MVCAKMAGADLLIYGIPAYLMNMTGLLKTLLGRTYC
jgi:multimeric flavodoxin WrbA